MIASVKNQVIEFVDNRSIVILGFGREGRSTYHFLRNILPDYPLLIADANLGIKQDSELLSDFNLSFELGASYLKEIRQYELVFKSPGISFKDYKIPPNQEISSQTDLFLRLFSAQCIGVTGTKGKSTTVSLLNHILNQLMPHVLLVGNIGMPALDVVNQINSSTIIIYELSSHQLEYVHHGPHIGILLNLFQEHLDHYNSYEDYRNAKWNMARFQSKNDVFICCGEELQVTKDIQNQNIESSVLQYGFGVNNDLYMLDDGILVFNQAGKFHLKPQDFPLLGKHNLNNLLSVLLVCQQLHLPIEKVLTTLKTFKPLAHRLEFVAEVQGVRFYNDSIATIPQATIKAVESIDKVATLILGGFDRGIDYQILIDFLLHHDSLQLLLVGDVGKRINAQLLSNNYSGMMKLVSFDSLVLEALKITPKGMACLFSPAASSYDSFKNFEERGLHFVKLVSDSKNVSIEQ